MHENELSAIVIDIGYNIHNKLGPGLLESVYEEILYYELRKWGLEVRRQTPIPVYWDNIKMDVGFRSDLIVEEKLLVEIKSVENLAPVHKKIALTYLRILNIKLALLLNFNEYLFKNGITRIVNKL